MPRSTLRSPFDLLTSSWFNDLGFPAVLSVGPVASCGCAPTRSASGNAAEDSQRGLPMLRLAIDIEEREDRFVVHASLPGFRKEEVELEVNEGVLTVSAKHADTTETPIPEMASEAGHVSGVTWHARERRYANYTRAIRLPEGVTGEGIKAELRDGVLTVEVPKPRVAPTKKIVVN